MPTFHVPLGVYTRDTPDFFESEAAWGGGSSGTPPGGDLGTVALYNNDPAGRLFRIYQIALQSIPAGPVTFFMEQRSFPIPMFSASPLRPDAEMPSGMIAAGAVSLFFSPSAPPFMQTVGSSFTFIRARGNFGILPTGWQFEITGVNNAQVISATYWYTILPFP